MAWTRESLWQYYQSNFNRERVIDVMKRDESIWRRRGGTEAQNEAVWCREFLAREFGITFDHNYNPIDNSTWDRQLKELLGPTTPIYVKE